MCISGCYGYDDCSSTHDYCGGNDDNECGHDSRCDWHHYLGIRQHDHEHHCRLDDHNNNEDLIEHHHGRRRWAWGEYDDEHSTSRNRCDNDYTADYDNERCCGNRFLGSRGWICIL